MNHYGHTGPDSFHYDPLSGGGGGERLNNIVEFSLRLHFPCSLYCTHAKWNNESGLGNLKSTAHSRVKMMGYNYMGGHMQKKRP